MSPKPLLLIGAGGHARSCIDVIEQEGVFTIAGLVGLADEVGTRVLGYEVLGTDDDLRSMAEKFPDGIVCAGQIRSADLRVGLFEKMRAAGIRAATCVSPRAYVSRHATVGEGTIVMHGAIVNAGAAVGRNCIINSQSLIEHDAMIGDHVHVSTRAAINGGAFVGSRCFVGSGALVREGVTVGEGTIVGMGQPVLANCPAGSRFPRVASSA